jgi:hypothetical protein
LFIGGEGLVDVAVFPTDDVLGVDKCNGEVNGRYADAYQVLRREYDRRHRNWIKDREDGKPYDDAAKAQHLSLCGFWEALEILVR